jgi:2-amino-4-hydroxy-6-hydroxymethyldihydropteridine diphosphokinase
VEERAYVALGANLGVREAAVLGALRRLEARGAGRWARVSSLYESAAVGMEDAPPFVNAVAELVPLLRPRDLLERMQAIEAELGRTGGHLQSREIDLDLVAFGREVCDREGLVLPHPRFHQRAFVLVPLLEIAPAFSDPRTGRPIDALVAALTEPGVVRRVSGRGWVFRDRTAAAPPHRRGS